MSRSLVTANTVPLTTRTALGQVRLPSTLVGAPERRIERGDLLAGDVGDDDRAGLRVDGDVGGEALRARTCRSCVPSSP